MKKKNNKFFQIILISLFFAAIWIPVVQMTFPLFEELESTEKRVLHKAPDFNYLQLSKFFTEYEKYFNDNFGFRNNLITMRSFILFYIYSQSPSGYVVLGNNGMLYFAVGLTGDDASKKYTQGTLKIIKNAYLKEMNFLNNNNIYFLSVVAPDKHTIYSEYLPKHYLSQAKNIRLDQRINIIKKITKSQEIDLRNPFMEAKKQHLLYYKTDSHWNNYGSFIAYQKIMKNLKRQFKNLEPLTLSDFEITIKEKKGGDLAAFIGMPTYLKDNEIEFKLKEKAKEKLKDDNKLNKAIVYHDSFFDPKNKWGTISFLSYHFKKTISIPVYKVYDLYNSFDNEYILKEKPEVVLYETVERDL